jgi:hypothetical protein
MTAFCVRATTDQRAVTLTLQYVQIVDMAQKVTGANDVRLTWQDPIVTVAYRVTMVTMIIALMDAEVKIPS